MSTDPVEQKNPPVQISDEFVMPREVAIRLIVCNKISNTLRKRCKRAMQIAVISRAPILQEMNAVDCGPIPPGDSEFVECYVTLEKGNRVYDISKIGKNIGTSIAKLVARLNMKQLLQKSRRIPTQRKQAQWAALHGETEQESRVNILDEMLDAIETEIARRTKARV